MPFFLELLENRSIFDICLFFRQPKQPTISICYAIFPTFQIKFQQVFTRNGPGLLPDHFDSITFSTPSVTSLASTSSIHM